METGLLKAQIQKWAIHFRERSKSKKTDDVLANLRGIQSVSFFLVFWRNVTFPKS
jgi:hypothetical protein